MRRLWLLLAIIGLTANSLFGAPAFSPGVGTGGATLNCNQANNALCLDEDNRIANPGTALGDVFVIISGAPAAGICPAYPRVYLRTDTSPNRLYFCNGTEGTNAVDVGVIMQAADQWTDGTNSYTCTTDGGCTVTFNNMTVNASTGAVTPAGAILMSRDPSAGIACAVSPTFNHFNFTGQSGSTETVAQAPAPRAGTASNLRVRLNNALPASETLDITFRVGAANTALTCTITATGTSCSDTTNTATVAAGDLINMRTSCSGATTGWGGIYISLELK